MTASDVITDIKKLVGIELHSIRPGANITVQDVDTEKDCLILNLKDGTVRSRPLSEIRKIWDEMIKSPAVHVDGVLHGSGTSRNQPETILANLPYVEWLKINNKKHIAYVGRNSHPYGTLKKMDSIKAAELSGILNLPSESSTTRIISVTEDISKMVSDLQKHLPGTVTALESGIYTFQNSATAITIFTAGKVPLSPGSYIILDLPVNPSMPSITLNHHQYYVLKADTFRALIEKHDTM